VTNNIAPHFGVGGPTDMNVTYDHNVALSGYQPFAHYVGSPPTFNYGTADSTDANGNVSPAYPAGFPYASQFVTWNPAALSFNLMLKAGSVAIGAEVAGAPTVDIRGVTRTAPYTAGAYSYPY
jgi:hypothetical protein